MREKSSFHPSHFEAFKKEIKKSSRKFHIASIQSLSHSAEESSGEFDEFESQEFTMGAQKNQLELHLDEPRIDAKSKLDLCSFWKANQFRYPDLMRMAGDILSIPISTVASESASSVDGREGA